MNQRLSMHPVPVAASRPSAALENNAARMRRSAEPPLRRRSRTCFGLLALLALLAGLAPAAQAADTFVKDLSSVGNVVVTATAVHPTDGSVYVIGTYSGAPVTIGTKTLPLAGGKTTGFIAKMGTDGAWRWAGTLADTGGNGSLLPRALAVGPNNVYVCGESTNGVAVSIQNGGNTYPGSLARPAVLRAPFVVNLNLNGVYVWANMATYNNAGSDAYAYDLAVDSGNNVYVCGSFKSYSIDQNGTGLNFGPYHAFPARDFTSTADWGGNTRDGYVAKLDSLGNWKWVATGGGKEDDTPPGANPITSPFGGGFFGVAVDSANSVYVVGNSYANPEAYHTGVLINSDMTTADWNVNSSSGLPKSVSLVVPNDASAYVAKISGSGTSEGKWNSRTFMCIPTASPGQGSGPWYGDTTWARGIAVVQDQPYVLFQQAPYPASKRSLVIKRLLVDLSGASDTATLGVNGASGTNDVAYGSALSSDASGNLYLAAKIGYPGATLTLGGVTNNLVVAGNNPIAFAGKLSGDLNWRWAQVSAGSPPIFGDIVGAVDPQTARLYFGGSFSNGILNLGPPETDTLLPATGSQGANARSFLSAIDAAGGFLQQVAFQLETEFGASQAQPPQTPQTVFRGTPITASVPPLLYEDANGAGIDPADSAGIAARAVTRHTCTGYEVLDTAIAGNTATYGFTINADTTARFNWKTEYALEIKNNLSGSQGGLTSTAAGSPDPIVQKHWVEKDTITTAFIDGVIPSPNPNEFGTRYRNTGYQGSGAASGVLNQAMAFNGANEYVDVGTVPAVSFTNGLTVEAWVKYDRMVEWSGITEFSTAGSASTFSNTIFLANSDTSGSLNFRVYRGLNSNYDLAAATAPNVLVTGQWMHVAAILDPAGNATLYVNGQPRVTTANPGKMPLTVARDRSYIGFGPASGLTSFPGKMGEVRLWATARTGDQVRSGMFAPLAGTEAGLVGYWKLADVVPVGSPPSSYHTSDSSPTGLDGTFVNGDSSNLVLGGFTPFIPWATVQSRQQVAQFIMSRPGTIEYSWVKENRIQVSTAPSALANAPSIVSGSFSTNGTGEFWFTNHASLVLRTPERPATPVGYQLKGFTGGLGNIATVTGDGDGKGTGTRSYSITNFTQGSAIVWDYSDRIYKGNVVIGNPINFAAGGTFVGAEAIPADEKLNPTNAPLAVTIVSGAPAGSTVDDMGVWDDVADKFYPLRPGVILLEWGRQSGASDSRNLLTEITVTLPAVSNASFQHIANTPPVPLDADKTNAVAFVGLKYSQRTTAQASDTAEFSVNDTAFSDPFWSVLLFAERADGTPANGDLTRESLRVRTVLTKKWDSGLQTANAVIGSPVTSSLHGAAVPHNGYVYFEKARYNADIYDRPTRRGPIIPVNRFPTARTQDNLVVVWYQMNEGLAWPFQAVKYTPDWPASTANRIVIASRLGSEGLDAGGNPQVAFTASRYEQVKVYSQPDRTRAGYNPNEEHALIAPSLLHPTEAPPAVYALRNNLNVTTPTDAYTSDPFVLVQYYDRQSTNYGMAAYQVQLQDVNMSAARLVFTAGGGGPLYPSLGAGNVLEFNFTAGPYSHTGLQSDEVVDLEPNENLTGLDGGRYRISIINNGPPAKFVLIPLAGGPAVTASAIVPSANPSVILTRAFPYVFEYTMKAGEPVLAPYPLQQVIGASTCALTRGENLNPNQLVYWEDHKKQPWAVSGSTDPAAGLRAQFYYPLQPAFWHPTAALGDCIPYVSNSVPIWVTNHVAWPAQVPVLKAGETLTYSGGEINRDDANKPGVPGVVGWAAGKVVFDDANPAMDLTKTVTNYLARLASPLLTVEVPLPIAKLPTDLQPASGNVTVIGTAWTFNQLDASLQPRVRYDQATQKLSVRGYLDGKTVGDPALTAAPGSIYVLQPNILTLTDSNALVKLASTASPDWNNAVSNLVRLSRDPKRATAGGYGVGLEPAPGLTNQVRPAVQFGPGLALLPNQGLLDPVANLREGYVTLAENDDDLLGDAPVVLHIVRIQKQPLFRGAIKTLTPPNPFDEKISLRHSGDFGGNAGDLVFQWRYRPDDGRTVAPPDLAPADWSVFNTPNDGRGAQEINLVGAGEVTLTDNRFFVRWRHANASTNNWSQWAGAANSRPPGTNELAQDTYVPQLAEGWVKRVIAGVNPFDARIQDFRNNNTPATYASMVQQAGAPYRGPVALNADQNVIEHTGLIELYTTVIERAKDLSIDLATPVSTPAVNNTLLLAASRIADLQLLLGNEAYTDAEDPTIGFGSSSVEYGSLAPTIFSFQNQMAALMDEELALLRGRSEEGAYPAFNRLLWNFTRAEGEAAYALSYNISDANQDGFLNEADARILYPQGHGDAWGQYLSALRTYYDLLRHPAYNWQSRSENLQIEGVVVAVDYLDERKFAQAAAAKAKAGAEVVNLTYRSRYVEDPDGQWQGYQDTDAARAWGVSDWARRAGTGALLDWVTANAILPANVTNKTGIEKVDRTTVKELAQISAQAVDIRQQLDNANTGLNPIGLATDVVPFDIDPIGFDASTGTRSMHFDQVYDRALKALQNALDVFDHANRLNNMLRQVAATTEQFAQDAAAQDLDFRNRLIEIFGTPYEGTIGPGKAYPSGYSGPDIYLYMYADVTGIQNVPPPSADFTAFFGSIPGGFVNTGAPGGGGETIKSVWSHYFTTDVPDVEGNTNTDFSKVLTLNLPQTASGYSFQAPAAWGSRRAPGEIQQVLSELVQGEADLQLALHDYDGLIGDIKDMAELVRAQSGLQAETIKIQEEGRNRTIGLNGAIFTAQSVSAMGALGAEMVNDTAESVSSALPTVVGLASDAFSALRGATIATGRIAKQQLQSLALVSDRAAAFLEGTKEVAQIQQDIAILKADFKYAMQEQLKEFESLLGDEAALRIEVFRRQESLRQISDKYRGLLESGLRLLEERSLHNRQSAGATQQNRYQDFTFRVARNDALAKYRAAFDLAARYVYLAAKAYDYETNLDPNHPGSARSTLTQIIRARTLGAIDNGAPRLGSGGLADALATLKVNFDVLRSQMGFNNPQGESGQFSLRNELFRMKGADGAAWRQELERHRVADLWQIPEFRRYCRPFAPPGAGAQPGMVIPFSSQIVFGRNFFGWPLGPGDSAYDPTQFATKVRSVGVWFDDYAGEGLGTTPRVYLVPAGLDIMYVPSSADFATREWNVVDQKIPVPLPVSQSNLRDPSWIPLRDSLNGMIAEIRRYSSFRAYHNAGFTPDQMSFDSRLVGRSAWNTRWLLIIPGGTLLADQTDGLDTFIYGLKAANGPATDSRGNKRDGHGVTDIKLSFQTYAISGN